MKRALTIIVLGLVLIALLLSGCQSAPPAQDDNGDDMTGVGNQGNESGDYPNTSGRPSIKEGTGTS